MRVMTDGAVSLQVTAVAQTLVLLRWLRMRSNEFACMGHFRPMAIVAEALLVTVSALRFSTQRVIRVYSNKVRTMGRSGPMASIAGSGRMTGYARRRVSRTMCLLPLFTMGDSESPRGDAILPGAALVAHRAVHGCLCDMTCQACVHRISTHPGYLGPMSYRRMTLGTIGLKGTVRMLDSDSVIHQPRFHHFFVAAQAGGVTDIAQISRTVRPRENNVGKVLGPEFNSANDAFWNMTGHAVDFRVWRSGSGVEERLPLMT